MAMTTKDSIMLLATRFDNLGDWTVEQQFVLQMGSSYLLAHGIGTPLAKDASTKFTVLAPGKYTLWVRTKNWTAFWSEGKTPGIFHVVVDHKADASEGNAPLTDFTPEEEIINDELHQRLMGYIDELPSLYKDVMIKYMIEELEYEEIAKELDLELNTVRTRIRRGKQHLSQMMLRGEVE